MNHHHGYLAPQVQSEEHANVGDDSLEVLPTSSFLHFEVSSMGLQESHALLLSVLVDRSFEKQAECAIQVWEQLQEGGEVGDIRHAAQ